jgi:RNA polymerase sigma-70 factor (ECF subfamily)
MGVAWDTHSDDATLLSASVPDPQAFGAFYDRYEKLLLAYFVRNTGRADLAADLTAEVFAAALASAPSYRPAKGSARGWLFGIARHELADLWQRGRVEDRARRRLQMEQLALEDPELARIEELAESEGQVLDALNALPPDQRMAVEGRVVQERDYAELAQRLRCSESVVRKRVSRGLRTMRTSLAEDPAMEGTS